MDDTHIRQPSLGNFTDLDDPAFLAELARVRGLLEHQPENSMDRAELEPVYEARTEEFCRRASIAWAAGPSTGQTTGQQGRTRTMSNPPGLVTLHSHAARLLATEVLLSDPEALADDVLESCLYLLRDRLQDTDSEDE
jgi:hypothetical protein